jgi:hypothetical protein
MKTTIKTLIVTGATLAAVLTVSPSAQAQIFASETFNYHPSGGSTLSGQTGGTGWSNGWNVSNASDGYLYVLRGPIESGSPSNYSGNASLSYTGDTGASGGNFLNLASGFSGPAPDSVTRSFNATSFGSTATGSEIGAANATIWGSLIYTGDTANAGGQGAYLQLTLKGGTGGGTNTFNAPITAATNFLVYKISYGANPTGLDSSITFFSNPNLATFNGTGGVTTSGLDLSFNTLSLTQGYSYAPGGQGTQVGIDDILFGANSAAVNAPFASAVPEPSTYAMLGMGIGAVWLMSLRRRKSAV